MMDLYNVYDVGLYTFNMNPLPVFIVWIHFMNADGSSSAGNQLYTDIMANYNRQLLPRCNQSDAVTVTLDMALREIVAMNEREQTLKVKVWIRQSWTDCHLQWKPSNYSGISSISLAYNQMWTPDITLIESADSGEDMPGRSNYRVLVYSDGLSYFNFPSLLTITCYVDVTYFPYDTQKCTFKLTSWTYNGLEMDVIQKRNYGDLSSFVTSNEWEVKSFITSRHVVKYGCCPEPFPDVTFTLTIKRKPKFYVLTIIFPCILVLSLAALGFLLPAESGEKVSLEVTVLLSLAVFLLLVSDKLPPSAETFPLIGVFFSVCMVIVSLSCVLTVLVLYLHFREESTTRLPSWARKIFLNKVSCVLCNTNAVGLTEESTFTNKVKNLERNLDVQLEDVLSVNLDSNQKHEDEMKKKGVIAGTEKLQEWRLLARVLDRLFTVVFLILSSFTTLLFFGMLISHS